LKTKPSLDSFTSLILELASTRVYLRKYDEMFMKRSKLLPAIFLRHRIWFIALFQGGLVFSSVVLAWLLRFDF